MKTIVFIVLLGFSVNSIAEDIFINQFEQNIAIRASQLDLVDPHVFAMAFIFCVDLTAQLNTQVQTSLSQDSDGDGYLDANLITQFATDQPAYLTSRTLTAAAINAQCPTPLHTSACQTLTPATFDTGTTFSETDNCLAAIDGTTSGYSPTPNITTAPCYATLPVTSSFNFAGVQVSLRSFQQAERYTGNLDLEQGLRMGFISETDAQNIIFPVSTPLVGGQTLASVLPGGLGNCSSADDRDIFTDDITSGWWFYFNSAAELIELELE